jgi:hypothetical protein
MDLVKQYAPEPNWMERYAESYLRRKEDLEQQDLRELGQDERVELRRIQRRAVIWASVAGIISGGILGGGEVLVQRVFLGNGEDLGWREQLPYWVVFLVLALVVSGIEILYLYRTALRAAARVSEMAGMALDDNGTGALTARGIARAALEYPNPHAPLCGIDPYARTPRWKLWALPILYRMKVGASSFVLRVLLRRVLGRAALRFMVPLIAGPLYAVWNAIITWRIVRETRVRAFGPFAVETFAEQLAADCDQLGDDARRLVVDAVGEMVICSRDAHPNFALLLTRLFETLDISSEQVSVDWDADRQGLPQLNSTEQTVVLKALMLAAVLDGRVRRSERKRIAEAHQACGRPFRKSAFKSLHRRLLDGQSIGEEQFAAVWQGG